MTESHSLGSPLPRFLGINFSFHSRICGRVTTDKMVNFPSTFLAEIVSHGTSSVSGLWQSTSSFPWSSVPGGLLWHTRMLLCPSFLIYYLVTTYYMPVFLQNKILNVNNSNNFNYCGPSTHREISQTFYAPDFQV